MTSGEVVRTWTKQINEQGEFVRRPSSFRGQVTADGSSGFQAEAERYHLYVSYACPWAHRTLIVRKLKGLEDCLSFDVVHSFLGTEGWRFDSDEAGATGDRVNRFERLRQAYLHTAENYAGAITVPVLWDRKGRQVVNNESSEIIVMLNDQFQDYAKHSSVDLNPEGLRAEMAEVDAWIYETVNNGVYRCGFARSQSAYGQAATRLFDSLSRLEGLLSDRRYLCGNQLTLSDIRLFTTLVRFDAVYHTHFKCNLRRIVDYPNLWGYTRDIYSLPGVAETTNMQHIRDHYYKSHLSINPYGIVPIGPEADLTEPHDRARLSS